MTIHIPVAANGRISLPADVRKRLGVARGGALLLEETGDGVVLRTVSQSIKHAQKLSQRYTAKHDGATVDAFLAQRRDDSGE
jgi:AbrB family looped-hinge helix DNA binding protein